MSAPLMSAHIAALRFSGGTFSATYQTSALQATYLKASAESVGLASDSGLASVMPRSRPRSVDHRSAVKAI